MKDRVIAASRLGTTSLHANTAPGSGIRRRDRDGRMAIDSQQCIVVRARDMVVSDLATTSPIEVVIDGSDIRLTDQSDAMAIVTPQRIETVDRRMNFAAATMSHIARRRAHNMVPVGIRVSISCRLDMKATIATKAGTLHISSHIAIRCDNRNETAVAAATMSLDALKVIVLVESLVTVIEVPTCDQIVVARTGLIDLIASQVIASQAIGGRVGMIAASVTIG